MSKMTPKQIKSRLAYLRKELRAERISQGELLELQSLAEHIDPSDVELLEAAGVPEHPQTKQRRDIGALDQIQALLDGKEWAGAETLSNIAQIIRETGRTVKDIGEIEEGGFENTSYD